MRAFAARSARSVALVGMWALAAAAVALGVDLLVSVAARTGPTRLAGAMGEVMRPWQGGLLPALVAAGLGLSLAVWGGAATPGRTT